MFSRLETKGLRVRSKLLALPMLWAAHAANSIMKGEGGPRKILFVIGTGRSGTHFLSRCLIGHKHIRDLTGGHENPLVFNMISKAALDRQHAGPSLEKAGKRYDAMAGLVNPDWFLDQSHPNIWFATHWSSNFPEARFVGIIRNPYSVVASMMKHKHVLGWIENWESYNVPNEFLGISSENSLSYAKMTIAERCTLRWISHYRKLEGLGATLGNKLVIIHYEDLCRDPVNTRGKVADLLEVANDFKLPSVDHGALTRGASMPANDIAAIERLLVEAKVEQQWRRPLW
jgi:hypothetical protein